jgi:hypothetical protein
VSEDFRPLETYGDVQLSVQASVVHYCRPRVSGLPLDEYSSFEIGLMGPVKQMTVLRRKMRSRLCRPSEIGVLGFDQLFEEGDAPVAGYVSREDLDALRAALRERASATPARAGESEVSP